MLLQAKQQREISQLRLELGRYFSLNELRNLCFDLSIDSENLSNTTKDSFARELIIHMLYQRRISQLLEMCRQLRPQVDWPEITESINQTVSTKALQAAVKAGKVSLMESRLLQKLERFLTQGMLEKFAPISEHLLLKHVSALKVKAHTRVGQLSTVFDTFDMRYLRNSMATSFGIPNDALLVLGNPQASETYMLVECRQLLFPALETTLVQPSPMIFDLAHWADNVQNIATWLAGELNSQHAIPQRVSHSWIDQGNFLILLKGFDRLPKHLRGMCKVGIAEFQQTHELTRLAISAALGEQGAVSSAASDAYSQNVSLQAVALE